MAVEMQEIKTGNSTARHKFLSAVLLGIAGCSVIVCAFKLGFPALREHMRKRFAETHQMLNGEDDENSSDFVSKEEKSILDDADPSKQGSGFLSWDELGKTSLNYSQNSGGIEALVPSYAPSVKESAGKIVKIKGFMFPLEAKQKQSHFLVSPYTSTCPFCLPAPPSQLIEVYTKNALNFSFELVAIEGKFRLSTNQEQMKDGIFYSMQDATPINSEGK